MRILDRQRYWAYLKAYVICFVALVGMYVVFHAFSNLDEFAEVTDSTPQLLRNMGRYYFLRISQFYDQLCGVIGMMAAIFTVTWMQRDNELLAMLAAGVSTHRAIRPVIISAALVSTLAIVNQERVIPQIATELQRSPDDDGTRKLKCYTRYDVNDIGIRGGDAWRDASTIEKFNATLPISRFGTLGNLQAAEARYVPPNDPRSPLKGGWLLRGAQLTPADAAPDDVLLLEIDPDELKDFHPPRGDPAKLVGKAYFLRTNVSFDIATRSLQWYQYASTPELLQALRSPISSTERTEISVYLHGRTLRPLLSMALLCLSLPLVLGGGTRGMFINLGISLATSAVFYIGLFAFQYLGHNQVVRPDLTAWAPLILFGTIAAARWGRIRT